MELTNNIKGVAQYTINLFCIGVIILIMFVDYYEIFIVYYWTFNLEAYFVTNMKKIIQQFF